MIHSTMSEAIATWQPKEHPLFSNTKTWGATLTSHLSSIIHPNKIVMYTSNLLLRFNLGERAATVSVFRGAAIRYGVPENYKYGFEYQISLTIFLCLSAPRPFSWEQSVKSSGTKVVNVSELHHVDVKHSLVHCGQAWHSDHWSCDHGTPKGSNSKDARLIAAP